MMIELLQEVLEGKRYAEYAGGTLVITSPQDDMELFLLNVGDTDMTVCPGVGEERKAELSPEAQKLVAQIYLKYKAPGHQLYELAQGIAG